MARYFDGVDDIITSANTVAIQSYHWIVACWFRTSVASGKKIVGAEFDHYHPHLYVGTDGYLYWVVYDGGFKMITTSFVVVDNVWRMAVGVCQWNNSIRLWVDGQFIGTVSIGSSVAFNGYWRIGGYKLRYWKNGSDGYFPGEVADVRIYRLPLSVSITDAMVEAIIKSMYCRNPALRQYLYIWYPLWERGIPSYVLDHSGRYDNGSVVGTTYVDDPPQLAGSLVSP